MCEKQEKNIHELGMVKDSFGGDISSTGNKVKGVIPTLKPYTLYGDISSGKSLPGSRKYSTLQIIHLIVNHNIC